MLHLMDGWLAGFVLFVRIVASQDHVVFFYTTALDLCEYDGYQEYFFNVTAHGGLCAVDADVQRLYGCFPNNRNCWTWYQTCAGGAAKPSGDQILCDDLQGNKWCCPDVDQCTYNLGQINVCLSRFANPFYDKTVAQAREAEIAALGVTSLPSSASSGAPLVSPSPTDNIVLGSTLYATETSISTSSAIMSSTSPSSTSKGTSTSASARTSSTAPKLHNDDADLGKGTIAGITVGTIAGAATGGVAIWLIVKRYQKQRRDVVSKSRPDFVEDFGPRSQAYAPYELRDTSTKPIFEASGRGKPTEMAGQDIRHEVA